MIYHKYRDRLADIVHDVGPTEQEKEVELNAVFLQLFVNRGALFFEIVISQSLCRYYVPTLEKPVIQS